MNPLTESRQAIVAALVPLGVTIYGVPPSVVSPPAVLLLPSPTEWQVQHTKGALRVTWTLTAIATMQGHNEAALERLEQLAWDVRVALDTVGIVGPVSSPRVLTIGTAEVAATDLDIQVFVTN